MANTTITTITTTQAPDAKPVYKNLTLSTNWQIIIEVPNYEVPELVFGDDPKSVAYQNFVALLVEAIKQLNIRVENLDSGEKKLYPKIICGPVKAVQAETSDYLIIKPSKKGTSKGKLVKEIKSFFIKNSKEDLKKWIKILPETEIALYLPSGSTEIEN